MRTKTITGMAVAAAMVLSVGAAQAAWVQWTGPGATGNWYRLVEDSTSGWTAARARAQTEFGGDLATITSAGEQLFVNSALFGGSSPFNETLRGSWWLGGTDAESEGTWTWVTGEPWSFTNWGSGQPDNNSSFPFGDANGEDYLQLVWRPDPTSPLPGGWNDAREAGYLASDPNFANLPNLWLKGFIVERTTDPNPRPEPIPAPAALPLFAVALLGLAAAGLRRA
ncbi:lectin-like protein [Elioraea thermophila]|uniref:lectin-like protein n=1 Tax=Elioraea thermophila TaxID=2185104 RepID=UPI000DF1DD23|nr:lectin-like protein [Elioraea thermophila]